MSVDEENAKINNCIANKKSIIGNNKTSTKGKREIFILVSKANLVNKQRKDVKSNFKALGSAN